MRLCVKEPKCTSAIPVSAVVAYSSVSGQFSAGLAFINLLQRLSSGFSSLVGGGGGCSKCHSSAVPDF